MPITFACKCGKELRAQEEHAGQDVRCPACGRLLRVPAQTAEVSAAAWQTDLSPEAAQRAENLGLVRHNRASVARLTSTKPIQGHLQIRGTFCCWNCKHDFPLQGQIFGRHGLAGRFLAVGCPRCNARTWTGFATRLTATGTEVFLYAPSHARHYTRSEGERLPAPSFQLDRIVEQPPPGKSREARETVDVILSGLLQRVTRRALYQEVSDQAAQLANQLMAPAQWQIVCRTVRLLLDKEATTHLRAVLAETLLSLRDDSAGPLVEEALRRSLEQEDPRDPTNLPLHDLCSLSLLYGQREACQQALERGLKDLDTSLRVCLLGKRLSPSEVLLLVQKGKPFERYESTQGGANWQYLYPLPEMAEESDQQDERRGWLNKWFRRAAE